MEKPVMTRKGTTLLSYFVLKQKYYESLDIDKITHNKTFWKTISPLFSNKIYSSNSRITLLKTGNIFSEESKEADTFNAFFSNV